VDQLRQPAAFCGIVGMYPTYGSVSRHGAIAMGSSLDQDWTICKKYSTMQKLCMKQLGYDAMDATSITRIETIRKSKGGIKKSNRCTATFIEMDGISPGQRKF
jgi:aspartyl-tRNA(Asn)/glutamyl-tRNA(Gln) amidotransferase subunit A